MDEVERTLKAIADWYSGLPLWKDALPARGVIAAALVVVERLRETCDLDPTRHLTVGAGQIRGVSGAAVARILARYGETRPFLAEGGRTNRGAPGQVASLLSALRDVGLAQLDPSARDVVLDELQAFLVDKVTEYHRRERLKFEYSPSHTAARSVRQILNEARKVGKEGEVAQYLVGAKLQMRFPGIAIGNESYSTADQQLDRPGDFCVGDTAFHVTVAPQLSLYERCRRNLSDGYRVILLVPEQSIAGVRQNAGAVDVDRIGVLSIEAFVGQNLEELAGFGQNRLAAGFRRLLETYNRRVDSVETDKSLLIQIPGNLLRAK